MIYKQIKKLCKDRDLRIDELSDLSGISHKTIMEWDRHIPLEENLKKVADVLHVSTEYLYSFAVKKTKKCKYCGKEFEVDPHRRSKLFCCEECREKAKAIRLSERNKREGLAPKDTNKQEVKPEPEEEQPKVVKMKMSYDEKTANAKAFGLHYGTYVAIRDGYLKPPKGMEMIVNEING